MSDLRDDIRHSLDDFIARGIVGASLAVSGATERPLVLAAGLADRASGAPVTPDRLFKIGSCTKTFVAATLMSLVQDGAVALTTPVARWFPNLPFAERIRVRQLVDHTAGLPEFEFVTLAAQIRARVLTPLGLADTFAAAGEAFPAERLVHGYFHRPPPPPQQAGLSVLEGGEMWKVGDSIGFSDDLQDTTATFPMTGAYAAGDMVGTPSDLVSFLGSLVGGRLLSPAVTAEMIDNRRPGSIAIPQTRLRESGAGVWLMPYAGQDMLGHQGSMPGYVTVMVHHRPSAITLVLTTNTGSGNRLSFYASGLHGLVDAIFERLLKPAIKST